MHHVVTSEGWHLQVVHFREGDDESELIVVHVELEQGPAPDDLQAGQDDLLDIDVGDEDVAGDLPDVLEEAEVQVGLLEPSQLQVAVHVSAVGVTVSQVSIVVLSVVGH